MVDGTAVKMLFYTFFLVLLCFRGLMAEWTYADPERFPHVPDYGPQVIPLRYFYPLALTQSQTLSGQLPLHG